MRIEFNTLLRAGLFCLLAASVFTAGASAQSESPGIFSEIIDVRVVNIEVVVTDRSGDLVGGLSPADFELSVDGEIVPIEYFTEVSGGASVATEAVPGVSAVPSIGAGGRVGTSYLVFVDDYFAIARDRNQVLDQMLEELPLLGPEDRMAVVAFDGKKLEMLSTWTNSQSGLERTFKEAKRRKARGLERLLERRRLLSTQGLTEGIDQFSDDLLDIYSEVGFRLSPEERAYAELVQAQVQSIIQAASATLRSFAAPPGRKVMMMLAGGWPFDPPQVASGANTRAVLDSEFQRGFELYKPLVDTANLIGYTLYPIDVPGLAGLGNEITAAEFQPATLFTDSSPAGPRREQLAEWEFDSTLSYLANRTGGKALINNLRVDPLERVTQDTRSYYWLGFSPQRARDDKEHKIEVKALRPGLKVRSRRGYLDFSRQTEVTAMVESTLLFGSAPPSGALPVRLGEVKKAGRRKMEAPLTIAIPLDQITVLPIAGRYVAEVELRIAALDEEGNQAEIPVIPLRLAADAAPSPGGHARHDTAIQLRRQKHDLVISVYDPASGKLLTNRLEVQPVR